MLICYTNVFLVQIQVVILLGFLVRVLYFRWNFLGQRILSDQMFRLYFYNQKIKFSLFKSNFYCYFSELNTII
jgi:hypothetical protein